MGLADARHCFAAFDLGTRALPDAGLCFTAFDLGHMGPWWVGLGHRGMAAWWWLDS